MLTPRRLSPLLLPLAARLLAACGVPVPADVDDAGAPAADARVAADAGERDAGLGCVALARCINGCAATACVELCRSRSSPEGLRLLQAQLACVFGNPRAAPPVPGACANTGGGVCDPSRAGYSAAACMRCVEGAQSVGGACDDQVIACQRNP